jgi:hypothetical protein
LGEQIPLLEVDGDLHPEDQGVRDLAHTTWLDAILYGN